MIIHLDSLERHSPAVHLLRQQLEIRLLSLRTKCGVVQDKENIARDAALTSALRGQIHEVKLLVSALSVNQDGAVTP